MRKRKAINISVPNEAFKKYVEDVNTKLGTNSSVEFQKLYKRLGKKIDSLPDTK